MTIIGTGVPYFVEQGDGDIAILMLHGIGGGHRAFAPQMDALANAGYRAIAWDMPGYGFSRSVEPYDMSTLALACLDLIALIDASTLVLAGHSMGGMVAQEVITQAPLAVHGLVLAGTSAVFGRPDGAWQANFIAQRLAPLDAGQTMAQLAPTLVDAMLGAEADIDARPIALELMSAVPEVTYRQALAALVGFDRSAELAKIQVPTLVVSAERDANAPPSMMARLAAQIAGASSLLMPQAGHLMNLEVPGAFNAGLLAFLAQHFPVRG